MKILVLDIGGTSIKIIATGHRNPIQIPSGPGMTAARMVKEVKRATAGWRYDAVSIGYPGPVRNGRPAREPWNLGGGWTRLDFRRAFGKPVRIANDAAMQALGSYRGGRMLFLGLGTGLGSALVTDGVLVPLELAHLPYRDELTYEDFVGVRGRDRLGQKRWARHVANVVALFRGALLADYVVLGGGLVMRLQKLPPGARRGRNTNAFAGGFRLWRAPRPAGRRHAVGRAHSRRIGPAA